MTRIPHHLLRTSACLTGGLLALSLILIGAVCSAVLAAGVTLFRFLVPVLSRASGVRAARRPPVRTQSAARAEPAV
jgi:hypothetical protein